MYGNTPACHDLSLLGSIDKFRQGRFKQERGTCYVYGNTQLMPYNHGYGKRSKISNTLKLRTPKIITENNF